MKRFSIPAPALIALGAPLAAALALSLWAHPGGQAAVRPAAARVKLSTLAVPFVANDGQTDSRVAFYASTFAGTAFVTRAGSLVLSLPPAAGSRRGGWTLVERPLASQPLTVRGAQPATTRVNIFHGPRSGGWRRDVAAYGRVTLGRPWRGIGYALQAHGNNVERIFTVAPGADAGRIRMRVRGARALRIEHGRLVAVTGYGPVTLSRPRAWQSAAGRRHIVPVHFSVHGDTYGFRLGPHDSGRPVVIDPLIRATYLGGSDHDAAQAMQAATANGNVYIAGKTDSTDFPGTAGGAQPKAAGGYDAFVAELSPDLTQLLQATYLGGSNDDFAVGLAIGPPGTAMAGDVYVAGDTFSTDFPGTSGGAQPNCAGSANDCTNNGDGFVAVLSSDLSRLLQASYLGGTDIDDAHALAVAPASSPVPGDVYVAGRTLSSDFPGTAGGAQPQPAASGFDGFVARLDPGLTHLAQATYLGGSAVDEAFALAVAPVSGGVYVAGDTSSADFPCTQAGGPVPSGGGACLAGAAGAQSAPGGGFDAFVSLLTPTLAGITQSTYLGGSDLEDGFALALAPPGSPDAGDVYLGGRTLSANLPGVANGAQPTHAGGYDGFVGHLSGNLQTLRGATYLGAAADDVVTELAGTAAGTVYAAGETASQAFPCTTATGPDPHGGNACGAGHAGAQWSFGGATDGFIALFPDSLAQLDQATYFGGRGADDVHGLSLAPASGSMSGAVYIAGQTRSTNFQATAGAAQPAFAGTSDGYAAAVGGNLQGPETTLKVTASVPGTVTAGEQFEYHFTVTNDSPASGNGSNDATDVVASDVVNKLGPGQVEYLKATASQGQGCTEVSTSGVVSCQLGTIAKNGGTATVTVKVQATGHTGGVTNQVTVTSDEAPSKDAVLARDVRTTIQQKPGSGGGALGAGMLGALALLALAVLVDGRRRRRPRPSRGR